MARPSGRDVARALEAAREGDQDTLQLLTTGRKAASAPLVLGGALHAAAKSGHVDALKALLQLGAPAAGAPGADRFNTPLIAACAGGHAECAAVLLAHGAQELGAVRAALSGDHSGCLRALITSRGSLNPQSLAALPGLLSLAAGYGALACMDELCQLGCDPCSDGGYATSGTPLSIACAEGRTRAVAWLLEHGAPVDAAPPPKLETALYAACVHGHTDCAALLLHHGANVDLADGSGVTPLAAALSGDHAACATLLLDHGAHAAANCLVDSRFGRNALCWGLVPKLLAAGADAECRDRRGFTPLITAAMHDASDTVRALCAAGADARAAADSGRIPLHNVAVNPLTYMPVFVTVAKLTELIENAQACADELIERGGADTLFTRVRPAADGADTALERGLMIWADSSNDRNRASMLQLRDGCLALLLARWPLSAPLPEYDGVGALLPAAVVHAQRRLEVLHSGRDDSTGQQALTAAFLRRVRDACGCAVAPAHAPFARFRFVAGGGLERAWAGEREVHRFPVVERVALQRAALQVASDAQAAAAERCVPLLRELSAAGSSSSSSREAEKLRYAAAVAVGRWGAIRAAVSRAEEVARSGEAGVDAAVAEAEAQMVRLQAKAAEAAAAARATAPVG